jgi:hypothetical protein
VLEAKQASTIDFSKAQAQARATAAAINHEGPLRPIFARVSQNMAAAVALLDNLPKPFADGVDKVYHQLKDVLGVAFVQ